MIPGVSGEAHRHCAIKLIWLSVLNPHQITSWCILSQRQSLVGRASSYPISHSSCFVPRSVLWIKFSIAHFLSLYFCIILRWVLSSVHAVVSLDFSHLTMVKYQTMTIQKWLLCGMGEEFAEVAKVEPAHPDVFAQSKEICDPSSDITVWRY